MGNEFLRVFKKVVNDYTSKICDNCNLLNSLLADYACGEHYKERRLLIWILETNCYKTLTTERDFDDWKKEWVIKLNATEYMDKEAVGKMLDVIFRVLFGEPFYTDRGFKLLEKNNQIKAEKSFNKALEYAPNSSDAFRGKGLIAFYNNQFDNAIDCFSNSIKYNSSPSNSSWRFLANSYENRGDKNNKQGLKQSAVSDYEQSINIFPVCNIFVKLADCYHELSKFNDELAAYDKVINLNPDNIDYYERRADLYLKQGNYNLAINDYNIILKKDTTYLKGYEKRSEAFFKQKNYNSALEDCNSVLSIEPKNAIALYHCCLIYIEMKNFKEARLNLELAKNYSSIKDLNGKINNALKSLNSKESSYYEQLGDNYLLQNKSTSAIDAFSNAIKVTPTNSKLHFKLGNVYNEKNNMELAKANYQLALKWSVEPLEQFLSKGFSELIDKNYTEAITNFIEAIKINEGWKNYLKPYLAKAYTEQGIISFNENDFDTAIEYISKAVKEDDKNKLYLNQILAKSYYEKGQLLLRQNKYDEAIKYFRSAIQIDISIKDLINPFLVKSYCKKGDEYFHKNEYNNAIVEYENALYIQENREAYIKLVKCYHSISNFISEIDIISKLISIDNNNIELYMQRAEAYILSNDYTKALVDYNIVLTKNYSYLKAHLKLLFIYYMQKNYDALYSECLTILNIDPNNIEASYISHAFNEEKNNFATIISVRENWERKTSYMEKTIFPFKCSNCSYFSSKNSTCKEMEKARIFALTSDGSRCHQYLKNSK
jgi:tetratricopeptide (TPR) repeat protein